MYNIVLKVGLCILTTPGIEEFDREAEKRYESIRKEMQGLLNEANLTVLKLCVIIKEVYIQFLTL